VLGALVEQAASLGNGSASRAWGMGFCLLFHRPHRRCVVPLLFVRAARRGAGGRPLPVSLVTAVHAGDPSVRDGDLIGHALALRLACSTIVGPNEILVSEPAKLLAERRLRRISFSNRRTVAIRGTKDEVAVHSSIELPRSPRGRA
jgi:hypothetical protein